MTDLDQQLRAALRAKTDGVSQAMLRPPPVAADSDVVHLRPSWHPTRRRRRYATVLAAAAVAAVLAIAIGITVAGRGGNPAPVQPALNRSQVPWSQVGPDWTLVVAFDGNTDNDDLLLAGPTGARYLICRLPHLLDVPQPWTTSTGKAILTAEGLQRDSGNDVLIVDLHTGVQTRTSVPTRFTTIQFATPKLDSLLVVGQSLMQTVDIATGRTLVRFPAATDNYGSALSPDSGQVAVGTAAGISVFDRASGRQTRVLAHPKGYGYCLVTRWLPSGDQVLAECFSRVTKDLVADVVFPADGRTAPQPERVPAGWRKIRLGQGAIAYQHAQPGRFEPRDVAFARVDAAGRLTPLSLPAELEQGSWQLAGAGVDVLLFEESAGPATNPDLATVAAWNPLAGTFTVLITAGPHQRPNFLYSGWQQSQL